MGRASTRKRNSTSSSRTPSSELTTPATPAGSTTPSLDSLAREPWVLELAREMRSWAQLQQFGTMLEACRRTATEHGVEYETLQRAVARAAIDGGVVKALPKFETVADMEAAERAIAEMSPAPRIN